MAATRVQERIRKHAHWVAVCCLTSGKSAISFALALMMVALLVVVPAGQADGATSAVSMRRIVLELRPGQSSFAVTVDSKRVVGRFPRDSSPSSWGHSSPFRCVPSSRRLVVLYGSNRPRTPFTLLWGLLSAHMSSSQGYSLTAHMVPRYGRTCSVLSGRRERCTFRMRS